MVEQRVGVFGANGHTGRFVAAELIRRGLPARWIGRNQNALSDLQTALGEGDIRLASVEDPASLRHAFEGLDAVINCAGPFLDTARPVIAAALDAGCHVLDITAEQVTVLDTIATFDSAAQAAGRVVMPAVAFFGGLADLLATSLMQDWTEVDEIEIAVALDSWRPTQGTRLTGERNTAPRLVVRDGALAPIPTQPPRTRWSFPDPFGEQPVACVALSEIILLSRHVRADRITSYMNAKPLADLADAATPTLRNRGIGQASEQVFTVSARVSRGTQVRQATLDGRDIYAVSAPLAVEAVERLLRGEKRFSAGVRAPGEMFDAHAFLAALSPVLHRTGYPSSASRPHSHSIVPGGFEVTS